MTIATKISDIENTARLIMGVVYRYHGVAPYTCYVGLCDDHEIRLPKWAMWLNVLAFALRMTSEEIEAYNNRAKWFVDTHGNPKTYMAD